MYEKFINNEMENETLKQEYRQYKMLQTIIYLLFFVVICLSIVLIIYLTNIIGAFSILLGVLLISIIIYIGNNWTPLEHWETSLSKRIDNERKKKEYFSDEVEFCIYDSEPAVVIDNHFILVKYMDKKLLDELLERKKKHRKETIEKFEKEAVG